MQIEDYKESHFRRNLLVALSIFFAIFCLFLYKIGLVINVVSINESESSLSFWEKVEALLPLSEYKKDPQRIDVLILGIRGEGDPEGGLLTDMIMVASYKKDTGQLALISIPRDLYVFIPGHPKKERLNFAYAFGEAQEYGGGGLRLSKRLISNIIGLDIDYAVSIDFKAFQEIIDILGGVTVYLEKPFLEDKQWQGEGKEGSPFWLKKKIQDEKTGQEREIWAFYIPEGKNLLDGNTALYYVRSRFTTSDFDRCKRQQQILLAMKEKAFSLGVLANPLNVLKIADSLKRHLRVDAKPEEIPSLIELAYVSKIKEVRRKVFDTSAEGLLYSLHLEDGSFVLLPVGNNFNKIQETCQNIFK